MKEESMRQTTVFLFSILLAASGFAIRELRANNVRTTYESLQAEALRQPRTAWEQAQQLPNRELRDRVERAAFASAVARDTEFARKVLPSLLDREWVGEVSFLQALDLSRRLDKDVQFRFLKAAAANNPMLAVREVARYKDLPNGPELFEFAVSLAPDEAVSVASGGSDVAKEMAAAIRASSSPLLQNLARLLDNQRIDDLSRSRLAIFATVFPGDSARIARVISALERSESAYFHELVEARLEKGPNRLLDRTMENFAQMALVGVRDGGREERMQLAAYPLRDLYLLFTFGRTETGGRFGNGIDFYQTLFDEIVAPKLRATRASAASKPKVVKAKARPVRGKTVAKGVKTAQAPSTPKGPLTPAMRVLEEVKYLHLRHFLSQAVMHDRLQAFLNALGPEATQTAVLLRVFRDLDGSESPVEQAVAAAEVLDAVRVPAKRNAVGKTLKAEYARTESNRKVQALYGMLAVRFVQQTPTPELNAIASSYRPYVRETRVFDAGSLFTQKVAVQRHFFWNDDDGVESYESFRATYSGDPRWRMEKKDGYVHLTGVGKNGKRIEIYANIPVDILHPANRNRAPEIVARQDRVSEVLAERKLQPLVLVHRGHSYHLDKTLPFLNYSAKLVYLGSCNGMDRMAAVAERAGAAQIIATRGVGTMKVNDPVLKAINDEMLNSDVVDWTRFWALLRQRMGSDEFRDYIAPHQNAAASMLGAYFDFLAAE
jgi:hypothetical protein